jgi:hypothetical protein
MAYGNFATTRRRTLGRSGHAGAARGISIHDPCDRCVDHLEALAAYDLSDAGDITACSCSGSQEQRRGSYGRRSCHAIVDWWWHLNESSTSCVVACFPSWP